MSDYKYNVLNDALAAYVDAHRSDANDPLLRELQTVTRDQLTEHAIMQISADQGALLQILVAAMGVKTAVEIGTFTGYSSLCIARGLQASGGKLHCFDLSDEFTQIARNYWQKAGVADRVTLHLGPAQQTLAEHCPAEVDFAFIDADKPGYDAYYELLLPRVRSGGLILFDNMLYQGEVTDESVQNENVVAIRALNDKLTADDRVESMILTVADGIHVCRKK